MSTPRQQSGSMSFIKPVVNLDSSSGGEIRTLPDLVEFHIRNNPTHLFCMQAEDKDAQGRSTFTTVNYAELGQIIIRCQSWLKSHVSAIHLPTLGVDDGTAIKSTPIAVLMESNLSLAAYILSLMGLGVPVVLLSARLSPVAIRHLIERTGSKIALVSQRLLPLLGEALASSSPSRDTVNGEGPTEEGHKQINGTGAQRAELNICVAAGYHAFTQGQEFCGGTVASASHYVSEADRNVLILHSSGTSGLPKPIYCSHRHFLGFSQCEDFKNSTEAQGLTISTSPFFHGFGLVPICLSLGLGKAFCIPPSSQIPTGSLVADLIESSNAKALMTVPSLLEEMAELPRGRGIEALQRLDFVAFGGGLPKTSAAEKLDAAGVKLINHYGATETGPLTPFFVPTQDYDWHYLRLRRDIVAPLDIKFGLVDSTQPNGGAYKLSLRPFGWQERFELQDLLIPTTPDSLSEFSIAGRTDDLICLATGEKVRPTMLETSVRQHHGVRAAVALGDGWEELAIIVESTSLLEDEASRHTLRTTLWPLIEKACQQMDAHAKISSPAAVIIVPPGALPRSDKGTVLRKEACIKFALEIEEAYRQLDAGVDAPAFDTSAPETTIREIVQSRLEWRTSILNLSDDDDFFELGMDSLQATRLRRLLAASIRAAQLAGRSGLNDLHVADDMVYRNPSIRRLAHAITEPQQPANGTEPSSLDQWVDEFTIKAPSSHDNATVVITGSTGSLGSFFLAHLLSHTSVSRVICLVRTSQADPVTRQRDAMAARGINISEDLWSKAEIYNAKLHEPDLGLDQSLYEQIASKTTHVVHMAWPMNFKMSLMSYRASMKALQNMIRLSRDAYRLMSHKRPRLLFISSISTVGNTFPVLSERFVPERPAENDNVSLDLGYAKAKLVCEKMVERAASDHPEIDAAFVRVGQVAGSRSGFWNAEEHFAALVISSDKLRRLPDLGGTLSWIPVDAAAAALAEIVFHPQPLQLVYHLENPVRQSWKEMIQCLCEELGLLDDSIIHFDEWLKLVQSGSADGNPARKLSHFLGSEFRKMSCGEVILDTATTRAVSPTLRMLGHVTEGEVKAYMQYWRSTRLIG